MTEEQLNELAQRALSTPSVEAASNFDVLMNVLLEANRLDTRPIHNVDEKVVARLRTLRWARKRTRLPLVGDEIVITREQLDDLLSLGTPYHIEAIGKRVVYIDVAGILTPIIDGEYEILDDYIEVFD